MFYLSIWTFEYRGAGRKTKQLVIKDVLVNTDDEAKWKTDTYYVMSALRKKFKLIGKTTFDNYHNINPANNLPMPVSIELTYKCKAITDGINFKTNRDYGSKKSF